MSNIEHCFHKILLYFLKRTSCRQHKNETFSISRDNKFRFGNVIFQIIRYLPGITFECQLFILFRACITNGNEIFKGIKGVCLSTNRVALFFRACVLSYFLIQFFSIFYSFDHFFLCQRTSC